MKKQLKLLLPLLFITEFAFAKEIKQTTVINNSTGDIQVLFRAFLCFGSHAGISEVCKHEKKLASKGRTTYKWKSGESGREVIIKTNDTQLHSKKIKEILNYDPSAKSNISDFDEEM